MKQRNGYAILKAYPKGTPYATPIGRALMVYPKGTPYATPIGRALMVSSKDERENENERR